MDIPHLPSANRTLSCCLVMLFTAMVSFSSATFAAETTQDDSANPQRNEALLKSRLPEPPEAFVWRVRKGVVFPKPEGWNEKQRSVETGGLPVFVYAASPEPFSTIEMFETGFTLQVIGDPMKLKGIKATDMAIGALAPFVESHTKEDVLRFNRSSRGDFQMIIYRFRDTPADLKPVVVHKFVLANNKLDRVYIFTFESPEDAWQGSWQEFGTPILSQVKVVGGQ